ncbi:hypothetical protein GCM10023229_14500 [Flavisolibacter ginsenosidimutans]
MEGAQKYIQTKAGFHLTRQLDALLNRIEAAEEALLTLRKQANDESNQRFFAFYFLLIAVLLATLVVSFVALRKNLTARKKAEESLRENKVLLRSIIDNTSSLIYVKDDKGRFTLVNKAFEKKYKLTSGQAIGKTAFDLAPTRYARKYDLNDQTVLRDGRLLEVEEDAVIEGKLHHFYSVKFPLQKRNGKNYGVAGIATDLTDLMTKKQVEKQKEIIETTVDAQEKERKHLSTELHDNINQLLASAKLMLDAAKTNPELHDICLRKCEEAIGEGISEIRNLSHALAAPSFAAGGFTSAVKDLADRINLSGKINVQTSLCTEDEINPLSEKAKIALYRIIQEQMNNTLKYAKASGIHIEVKPQNKKVYLRIADDGVGFNPGEKAKGIGLRNIENRIEFFSGKMNLVSSPNKGCVLQVELPMSCN